jgi:hypothetical protein
MSKICAACKHSVYDKVLTCNRQPSPLQPSIKPCSLDPKLQNLFEPKSQFSPGLKGWQEAIELL